MFDKQYRFKGKHALRVDQLTGVFDELSKAKLIDRNVDVYANAPLIGFLYGRTADFDDLKNPETGQVYNQNVMGDRVIYSGDELQYNFWLIMLLDANYEPDEEKRIDKAFRHYGQNPADEERFDSYVRGGIDVLYEKLVEGDSTPEAFASRLYEFIDEFNDRFNSEISSDDILQLYLLMAWRCLSQILNHMIPSVPIFWCCQYPYRLLILHRIDSRQCKVLRMLETFLMEDV